MQKKFNRHSIVLFAIPLFTALACGGLGAPIQAPPITQVVQVVQVTAAPPITQVILVTQVVPDNSEPSEYQYQVYANQGWQDTGIRIEKGNEITMAVLSGRWTQEKGRAPFNSGEGGGYICANAISYSECVEPMPDIPQGALIGKVGNQEFGIGNGNSVTALQTGVLQLRINDGDEGLYDNDGALLLQVIVKQ
jgi:hypothetical protein